MRPVFPLLLTTVSVRIFCAFLLLLAIACKKEEPPKPPPPPKPALKLKVKQPDTLGFKLVAMDGFSSLKQLEEKLGAENMFLIFKLNRLDRDHIRDNDTLVVPNIFDERLAPFPAWLEAARDIHKIIIVSRRAQVFAAYDSGMLVRWGPTSTGKKKTRTPEGLYAANWKKDTAISTVDPSWILPWCVNIHNTEGISFHQFDLPGYPASHSCIRLLVEDATWIFDFVDTWRLTKDGRQILAYGTPVIIFDEYRYGAHFLRRQILKNPAAHYVSPMSLDSVLMVHKPEILKRQEQRLSS
jgi:hypothetical protein